MGVASSTSAARLVANEGGQEARVVATTRTVAPVAPAVEVVTTASVPGNVAHGSG